MPVGHLLSTGGTYVPDIEPLDLGGELFSWGAGGWLVAISCAGARWLSSKSGASVSLVLLPSLTLATAASGGDI